MTEPPPILARGDIQLSPTAHPKGAQLAIRDDKSLAELLKAEDGPKAVAQATQALGVKTVDFDREMIIVVSVGPVRGRLLRLDVSSLQLKKGELQVNWIVTRTMGNVKNPLLHPARLVLTKKATCKVVFAPPMESLR